jgi:hypothetical protein
MLENINSEELVPLGLNPGVGEPVIDVSIVQRLVGTFLTVVCVYSP